MSDKLLAIQDFVVLVLVEVECVVVEFKVDELEGLEVIDKVPFVDVIGSTVVYVVKVLVTLYVEAYMSVKVSEVKVQVNVNVLLVPVQF